MKTIRKNGYKALVVGRIALEKDGKFYKINPNLAELDTVIYHHTYPTLSPQKLREYDTDLYGVFDRLLQDNQIFGERTFIKRLARVAVPIVLEQKHLYDRPRPPEFAKIHGIDFVLPYYPESANSPSFPSGHATQAHLIALQLSLKYPHLRTQLTSLANEVAQSRLELGVHFPSDILAGKELAIQINKKLQKNKKHRVHMTR